MNSSNPIPQCGHGFSLNENGRCTGKSTKLLLPLAWCVSLPPRRPTPCGCLSLPSSLHPFTTSSFHPSLPPSVLCRPSDEDECTQFPSVCPPDRPVCTNTYGSYKCRGKRRCNQGFEPNDDGSACVGECSGPAPGWAGISPQPRCLKPP